ncbi:MAG: serine/threonine-protein kinase [Isosphaerales bacterium]
MPGYVPDHNDAGDLEEARRIHRFCEDFETRWRAGGRPLIEDVLERDDHDDHDALFEELLFLELELRREAGETPTPSEYRARFSGAVARVEAIFSRAVEPGGSMRETLRSIVPVTANDLHNAPTALISPHGAGRADSPSRTNPTFDFIGDYEVLEEIARGGMGVVFKARHKDLKRLVALKMILSGQMATPEERERFRREAELAANLDHPNIVPIFEVSEFQGSPYFSMKLIEGESLAHQLSARKKNKAPFDPDEAARLMATLARALDYAHERGFLHCDLKPSNILLDREGRPHVTDFGLARRTSEESTLSISGAIMGTPSYMAPEQASGVRKGLSPATDVYGLGAIFFELLTGEPPFRGGTVMETVVQVLERDPDPPRELRADVPKELETICLKCLEKSPQNRYPTAAALAGELDRYLQGEVIDATSFIPRLRRWNRREPELVARLGGLGLVALIAQYNYYFVSTSPNFRLHYTIQGILALWALSAVVFQGMMRSGWQSDRVRVLWSAADILFLSIELKLFEEVKRALLGGESLVRFEATLLVGYPLLIAASGLWWRIRLVWITTLLAMAAYSVLYIDAALAWRGGHLAWRPSPDLQHPNIFLAALLLTGYVVARQVKRILLLSQYYEHRPNA